MLPYERLANFPSGWKSTGEKRNEGEGGMAQVVKLLLPCKCEAPCHQGEEKQKTKNRPVRMAGPRSRCTSASDHRRPPRSPATEFSEAANTAVCG
jgi:hypothetical protein